MQRTGKIEVNRWSQNRAGSIVMIGLSLIILMVIIKVIISTISLSITYNKLEEIKIELQKEVDDLKDRNEYLGDTSYYLIYTHDDFQLSGGNVIIINKD